MPCATTVCRRKTTSRDSNARFSPRAHFLKRVRDASRSWARRVICGSKRHRSCRHSFLNPFYAASMASVSCSSVAILTRKRTRCHLQIADPRCCPRCLRILSGSNPRATSIAVLPVAVPRLQMGLCRPFETSSSGSTRQGRCSSLPAVVISTQSMQQRRVQSTKLSCTRCGSRTNTTFATPSFSVHGFSRTTKCRSYRQHFILWAVEFIWTVTSV